MCLVLYTNTCYIPESLKVRPIFSMFLLKHKTLRIGCMQFFFSFFLFFSILFLCIHSSARFYVSGVSVEVVDFIFRLEFFFSCFQVNTQRMQFLCDGILFESKWKPKKGLQIFCMQSYMYVVVVGESIETYWNRITKIKLEGLSGKFVGMLGNIKIGKFKNVEK